jgi:hypothetical protein
VVLYLSLLTILRTFPNFSSVGTAEGQLELSECSKFPQVRIKNTAQKSLLSPWDRNRKLYCCSAPECEVNPNSRQIGKAASAAAPFDLQNGLRSGQQYGPGRIASLYFTSGKTARLRKRYSLKQVETCNCCRMFTVRIRTRPFVPAHPGSPRPFA